RGLQGADRVNFGNPNLGAQGGQCLSTTFTHVTEAANHGDLAGNHHVGSTLDTVYQGLAAAVQVVELGLGHRVVHVDGRESQFAFLGHLVQTVHACGGLFGHTLDLGQTGGVPGFVVLQTGTNGGEHDALFFAAGFVQNGQVFFCTGTQVQQQGSVATVVQNHVGLLAGPIENVVGVLPVLFQGFALDGE